MFTLGCFQPRIFWSPINCFNVCIASYARSLKGWLMSFMDVLKDTGTFYSSALLSLISFFC